MLTAHFSHDFPSIYMKLGHKVISSKPLLGLKYIAFYGTEIHHFIEILMDRPLKWTISCVFYQSIIIMKKRFNQSRALARLC